VSPPRPIRTPLAQRLQDLARGPLALALWMGAAGLCAWLLARRGARQEVLGLARSETYELSSPTGGRVDQVLVELLEQVGPGQEIARLDDALLVARIGTFAASVARLRAELEAELARLENDSRRDEDERLSELRRFEGDEESLRLQALGIGVELESDRVEEQRLDLQLARLQALTDQGVTAREELDDLRLQHERVSVRIERNEELLAGTRDTLELARQRRNDYAARERRPPESDPALLALGERIRVEELRLHEVEIEREALVLRAPVHAQVQQLLASPGRALTPGETAAVLVSPLSPEVLAYLPEGEGPVRVGQRARVASLQRPGTSVEYVVVRVGQALELLPQRLWRDGARPEYGLPVLARGPQLTELLPGERVSVRFVD